MMLMKTSFKPESPGNYAPNQDLDGMSFAEAIAEWVRILARVFECFLPRGPKNTLWRRNADLVKP